jgi:hypothetical protein
MTDAEHAHWQAYTRMIADQLGLKDWDIRISQDRPSNEGTNGGCLVWYGQRRATIALDRDLIKGRTDELRIDQRNVVIHELLHCHWELLEESVRLAFKDDDSPRSELFKVYFNRSSELTLDSIATAIAPLLPLPEVSV